MSLRTAVLTTIVAISAVIPVPSASALNYPTKPVHLIVPYSAGGGTDFFARLVGQKMSELVGQPIVMENKPGAATNLGADFVRISQEVPKRFYNLLAVHCPRGGIAR
jgi:tripartite-type tricarboxylate transporter receptor subunit TctC